MTKKGSEYFVNKNGSVLEEKPRCVKVPPSNDDVSNESVGGCFWTAAEVALLLECSVTTKDALTIAAGFYLTPLIYHENPVKTLWP